MNVTPKAARRRPQVLPRVAEFAGPLVWNGIEFRVEGARAEEAELIAWAVEWLDVSDSRYDESAEFQRVVHSVTPPRRSGNGYRFSVDFGSAPTAAFDQLLAVIGRNASRILIGSFLGQQDQS